MSQSLPPSVAAEPEAQAPGASTNADDTLERLAEDLLTDSCHRLRSACQIADYGTLAANRPLDPRGSLE